MPNETEIQVRPRTVVSPDDLWAIIEHRAIRNGERASSLICRTMAAALGESTERWPLPRHTPGDGKKLRAARKAKKITQVELAKAVGTNATSLAGWERGEQALPEAIVEAIRKHLA